MFVHRPERPSSDQLLRHLSDRFAAVVSDGLGHGPSGGGRFVGVEHEYEVLDDGGKVDFRELIHALGLGQPQLHPTDPYAYRLASGSAITSDGREAEVATPPEPVNADFASRVHARASANLADLRALIGPAREARGYSTHCSVDVPRGAEDAVATRYVDTFGPALMLLFGGSNSLGLAVRPRPGRVELCSSFVDATWLRSAVVFAVASARCTTSAVLAGEDGVPAVPRIAVRVEPGVHRFGYYLPRDGYGTDLYRWGRHAELHRRDRRATTAQDHLALAWRTARDFLPDDCAAGEVAEVDDKVSGAAPLLLEAAALDNGPAPPRPGPSVHGRIGPAQRARFELAPVLVSWDLTVFVLRARATARLGFACVPGGCLAAFYDGLDDGSLDPTIDAYLARPPAFRTLDRPELAARAGLYDALGPRHLLLRPERKPVWDGSGDPPGVELVP